MCSLLIPQLFTTDTYQTKLLRAHPISYTLFTVPLNQITSVPCLVLHLKSSSSSRQPRNLATFTCSLMKNEEILWVYYLSLPRNHAVHLVCHSRFVLDFLFRSYWLLYKSKNPNKIVQTVFLLTWAFPINRGKSYQTEDPRWHCGFLADSRVTFHWKFNFTNLQGSFCLFWTQMFDSLCYQDRD